ncbi:phosphatidylserine synthase [Nonlabens sp. MIC269]|uniref:CDP-alcohol phosphatidyltransferase family protein n=1 Tax=Nonlabens sp. MIC269 TaxID=1476901 RepID=UPI00071F0463|nr:CDP-alcohol phosphatidyltransferase family protein [Nonlabens sp. MIC269]ALM21844.1 phosphatidylserine synthase [Nonlabens sp. MIC269]
MKKQVPNLITLLNLLSGCVAAVYAFHDNLQMTLLFVAIGIGFDFFDGLVARLLRVQGELGKQLDSLADMVTSGLVPGIVMFQLLQDATGITLFETGVEFTTASAQQHVLAYYIPWIGFFITAASCYRLAKFNIDTRQTDSFIGLPTPANALFIISLGLIAQTTQIDWIYFSLTNEWVLLAITALSCFILNAELPLFALKFKSFSIAKNKLRYGFLVTCIVLLSLLGLLAIPCIIILYVALSMITELISSKKS